MSGSFGGWILKSSPIPITKKPDLNDPVLRAKLAKGMSVEIVIRNASRKPNQKEVLEAFNQRFGAGTAPNGTSLTNFQIEKV